MFPFDDVIMFSEILVLRHWAVIFSPENNTWWLSISWPSSKRNPFKRSVLILTLVSHYNDVRMSAVASQITSVSIVCSTAGSDADQRKHQSFASLAFVWGNHRWPVNSLHKRPVTQKMFPFDDVIMWYQISLCINIKVPRFLLWRKVQCMASTLFYPYRLIIISLFN